MSIQVFSLAWASFPINASMSSLAFLTVGELPAGMGRGP
jgi:hypothetical protein